jgi:hypothetical protein
MPTFGQEQQPDGTTRLAVNHVHDADLRISEFADLLDTPATQRAAEAAADYVRTGLRRPSVIDTFFTAVVVPDESQPANHEEPTVAQFRPGQVWRYKRQRIYREYQIIGLIGSSTLAVLVTDLSPDGGISTTWHDFVGTDRIQGTQLVYDPTDEDSRAFADAHCEVAQEPFNAFVQTYANMVGVPAQYFTGTNINVGNT